uniref:Uncharacterized protein LOC104239092 n=1 Tax=Nicotiana sylvestris TaxID=4096 RepID=A0A1U7XM07_NICSY|nr:PREDICTED: uncharacterized protein LOC104239092 [Nicotiana sylvestris]
MLEVFFAVAFSAAPLTLYVPPIRSLNLFVESIEDFIRQTATYNPLRILPSLRLFFTRYLTPLPLSPPPPPRGRDI